VSPVKQVYHCFGCGEGGNVFRFLEKIENLSFREVVERLARETGITLRYEGESPAERRVAGRREVLHRANAEAARLFHGMLLDGKEAADARAYLHQRGITQDSVERFAIGYAPSYPDFLLRRMSKAYSFEVLVEAGLVTRDGSGDMRDRFRGRLIFPIHDRVGNAVGFGARQLAAPGRPAPEGAKYINTAESPVYRKGSLLYNLHRAKADITTTERAFVVEGYTDVIALDQAGERTAVATCGTALGEDHFRLLAPFTKRVVLAFDSDEAGARAAERAYAFHQQFPVDVFVLILPEGEDPADFVANRPSDAAAALQTLADGAVPLIEYMIDRILAGRSLAGVEDRSRAIHAALEVVLPLEDPIRRESYARMVAGKTGERETVVMMELQRMAEPQTSRPGAGPGLGGGAASPPRPAASRLSPQQRVEREALRLLVQAPALCPAQARDMDPERFATPSSKKVFDFLREATRAAGSDDGAGALVAQAQDRGEQLGRLVAALAVEPTESDGQPTREYATAVFLRLEEFHLGRRIDALRRELERMNPQKDPRYEDLFDRMVKLLGQRQRLRGRDGA
jgi:DNA primase